MSRTSTLPKRLQPMLATLTDAPFDDPGWVFEDKYDGFRMIAEIKNGKVALYSRNGKIISRSYIEVAKALEGVEADAVIDGELVAIGKDGVSHFQLLQNALRHEAKLLYCVFDLTFENGGDLRKLPLLERKKRLKAIRSSACRCSCEQVRAGLSELQIRPTLMQDDPAAFDRMFYPGEVLSRCSFDFEEKRAVDLLNVDAALLNGFDAVRNFDQLAGCRFRV